jgi:hypothetical protein
MLAIYEATIDRHNETIRRAEANARRLATTTSQDDDRTSVQPQRRLSAILRRIAGTAATA